LYFYLSNVSSFKSFLYDKGPSWEGGAMGNYKQYYIFWEPINYDKLK